MSLSLDAHHRQIVQAVLATHLPPGFTARVLGSRAKGAARPYSDLDLAMKGDEHLTLALLADLADAFSESDLPFKVDVVDWRSVDAYMQEIIDRDGVEL